MSINFDKDLVLKYLLMFKISAIILCVTIVVAILLLTFAIPQIGNYFRNAKNLKEAQASILQKEAELAKIKEDIAREAAEKLPDNEMKVFYRDIKSNGSLTSDMLAGEVQEINELIKYYGIKIYKVNYTYDNADDAFYRGKKSKYSTCKMDLELFSNYMKFQGFLKDLYKHEHFLDIRSIEIKPYKKDKSVLNIKMTLSLYVEKDDSSSPLSDNFQTESDSALPETSGDSEMTIEF